MRGNSSFGRPESGSLGVEHGLESRACLRILRHLNEFPMLWAEALEAAWGTALQANSGAPMGPILKELPGLRSPKA